MSPGSAAAKTLGCLCPEVENNHGAGDYFRRPGDTCYHIVGGCPVHGVAAWNTPRVGSHSAGWLGDGFQPATRDRIICAEP